MNKVNNKKRLIILLSLILIIGFLTTNLVSYFISLSSLRDQIISSTLPLTSDNIYSEIQRDLIQPVFISSFMAHDTFLRDWVLNGEQDVDKITRYLKEIMLKYNTISSFFISETTKIYYHPSGILKKVDPNEERDIWYFRVREMDADYETNVDPDLANSDAMTIFINYKVYGYDGEYIGATGIGLTVSSLISLMEEYSRKYNRNIYFTDIDGNIMLQSTSLPETARNIKDLEGMGSIADEILSTDNNTFRYTIQQRTIHLNSRYITDLNWYLLVEQIEDNYTQSINNALIINLIICFIITSIILAITIIAVNAYQKINQLQYTEILDKNLKLEKAINKVKKLSGLLPICASCKKIRNDKGYWEQIESYIRDHSDAEFSHGICPDCFTKLYGDDIIDEK